MDIRQIRYLVHAIDRKSLSGAARDLGVSVQAVSKSIAELEREVGGRLLMRNKQGVVPTELGTTFYHSSLPVLEAMGALEKTVGMHAEEEVLRLVLAVPQFNKSERVCANIESMISRLVGIKSNVTVASGSHAIEDMREGRIDGIISVGAVHEKDVVWLPCLNSQPAANFSRNHPLAAKPFATIEDLSNYPVARDPSIDDFSDSITDLYLAHGLTSPVRVVHGNAELLDLFANEFGYCLSIYTPRGRELFSDSCMRPIAPRDAHMVPLCLVGPPREKQSPGFVKLYSFIASNMALAAQTLQALAKAE